MKSRARTWGGVAARARGVRRVLFSLVTALLILPLSLSPATASETPTYTYDALGRLTKVDHGTTGPNAGVTSTYTYDSAGNRTQVVVNAGSGSTTLTLSPTSLPGGTVGTAYSQTVAASGGTSPYTYSVSSGTLPAGLTLNSSTGLLSGTPTTAATSSFTITATDSAAPAHSASQAYSVTISAAGTLTLSPTTLPGGTVGTAYSQTITATGGTAPYTYSVSSGTLPAGLALSSGGVLSGTPTTAAAYSFTVNATDSAAHRYPFVQRDDQRSGGDTDAEPRNPARRHRGDSVQSDDHDEWWHGALHLFSERRHLASRPGAEFGWCSIRNSNDGGSLQLHGEGYRQRCAHGNQVLQRHCQSFEHAYAQSDHAPERDCRNGL